MTIIQLQHIKKYHAANLVLEDVTFQIQKDETIGLIGRNGSGKSTLLRLISEIDQPDEGMLTIQKGLRIGYLPQIPVQFEKMTVYEVLAYGFNELIVIRHELSRLEKEMAGQEAASNSAYMEKLISNYAIMQASFEQNGGYQMDTVIDQISEGLRIDRSKDNRLFGTMSGGEKTRIVLASQLAIKPDLFLLDEPTNHLDIAGVEWLEQFIRNSDCAFVIVSHDRYFLDAVVSRIVELEDGEAHLYLTDYSGYIREKEERLLRQFAEYKEQQKLRKKMLETIRQLEEWGRIGGNEKFFKRAAAIRKTLDRMELVNRPIMERRAAEFDLSPLERTGRRVISFKGLEQRFDQKCILKDIEGHLFYGERVVLLGENGSGKSTLMKLLLGEMQPQTGEIELGARMEIGYLAQQETLVEGNLTVLAFFKEEAGLEEGEARNILAANLFYGKDVFKPLASLSGGEWTRLRLALLVLRKPNVLLLDEPTNHLDLDGREALEESLQQFSGTILAISHDRYFINRLAQRIWELQDGKLTSYLGDYDHYKEKRIEVKPNECLTKAKKTDSYANKQQISRPNHKQKQEQMEKKLTELESEIALLDVELEALDQLGQTAELEMKWFEREEKQKQLDELMEQWVILSEENET